jgi:murein lipoprotein
LCHTARTTLNNHNFIWDIIMLKKITAIALALTLTACANNSGLEDNITSLTNKVDALSSQVSDLETQQKSAAADAQAAKMAAEDAAAGAKSANERIDNVVASFKK